MRRQWRELMDFLFPRYQIAVDPAYSWAGVMLVQKLRDGRLIVIDDGFGNVAGRLWRVRNPKRAIALDVFLMLTVGYGLGWIAKMAIEAALP
jgi:hypothetical protein